ncbi:MAG: hypothetical protein NVS2B12_31610 [Ktedonobacteraceae bacterium]
MFCACRQAFVLSLLMVAAQCASHIDPGASVPGNFMHTDKQESLE